VPPSTRSRATGSFLHIAANLAAKSSARRSYPRVVGFPACSLAINVILAFQGQKSRPRPGRFTLSHAGALYTQSHDKAWLRRCYVEDGMTMTAIAALIDCGRQPSAAR